MYSVLSVRLILEKNNINIAGLTYLSLGLRNMNMNQLFLNFRKNFCASTCSPVQKNFLKVSENNIIKGKKEPCGDWDTIDTGILLAMIQAESKNFIISVILLSAIIILYICIDSDGAEGEMVEMVESVEFHIHRDFMCAYFHSPFFQRNKRSCVLM